MRRGLDQDKVQNFGFGVSGLRGLGLVCLKAIKKIGAVSVSEQPGIET